MDLSSRIAALPDHTVYIVMREDVSPDGPCDFLDMETVYATRAGALRLAAAQDAQKSFYASRYPVLCVVAYYAGTYALSI